MGKLWARLRDARLKVTWVVALLLIGYIGLTATIALQSIALVAAKLMVGAVAGIWIDRGIFPYARPAFEAPFLGWQYRRAAIVCAAMLGMAIGI